MLPTSRRTLLKSAAASALTGAVAGVAASAQPRDAVAQAAGEDAPPPSTSTGKRAMATSPFVKARLKRMRDVMAGYVSRGEVPGIVTLLHRRGETQVEAVGKLAVDGAPVQRNSIFRVASMSKPVTAVGVMILVEECKVRLDDPVDPFLPELANRHVLKRIDGPLTDTVPAKRPITLRDLLTFRFGFGQLMAPPESAPVLKAAWDAKIGMGPPQPQAMPAMDEWLRRFGALPL